MIPVPTIVRYLRRDELMPSERPIPTTKQTKISLLTQLQDKEPMISVANINKMTSIAPTLATTNRLLNRAKTQIDPPVIRRPPRKLRTNITHQTIMPVSVYG